jgi:ribosomal protein S18 acetylase RimI-like enzyme
MTVRVRPATGEDFPAVAALLEELGRPKVLGTADEPSHRSMFESLLRAPDLFGMVAEEDRRVVGFIDVYVVPRLNFVAPQASVPDLIVTQGARSRGVGTALLREAEELARRHGAFALTLESANWRTRAHSFYERRGMQDAGKHFVKPLLKCGLSAGPEGRLRP